MKTWITLATLLAASSTYAAEVITLADGREVKLNDDFTWEYVMKKTAQQATETQTTASVVETIAAPAIATIPVITKTVGTTVVVNAKKPTMQLSDSGVDVLIGQQAIKAVSLFYLHQSLTKALNLSFKWKLRCKCLICLVSNWQKKT